MCVIRFFCLFLFLFAALFLHVIQIKSAEFNFSLILLIVFLSLLLRLSLVFCFFVAQFLFSVKTTLDNFEQSMWPNKISTDFPYVSVCVVILLLFFIHLFMFVMSLPLIYFSLCSLHRRTETSTHEAKGTQRDTNFLHMGFFRSTYII